jgi:hypothetical protein
MSTARTTPRRFSREGFHARWDSIIGKEAAELRYRAWKARAIMALSLNAGVVVIIGGALLARSKVVPLAAVFVVGYALFAHAAIWLGIWLHRRPLQYPAASAFLGTEITSAARWVRSPDNSWMHPAANRQP